MPTCDPMSSAAPPSDTLRRTQLIEISPNLIKPMSRAGRRWVFRAYCKSMIFIWAPGWVRRAIVRPGVLKTDYRPWVEIGHPLNAFAILGLLIITTVLGWYALRRSRTRQA